MTETEHASEVIFSKDAPYLALTGELWGVFCDDVGENWPCYNGIALYGVQATAQTEKFMRSTWGPPGSCRPQVGPMLAPWTLLSGRPSSYILTPQVNNAYSVIPHSEISLNAQRCFFFLLQLKFLFQKWKTLSWPHLIDIGFFWVHIYWLLPNITYTNLLLTGLSCHTVKYLLFSNFHQVIDI